MNVDNLYQHYINCGQKVYTDTRKPLVGGIFFALKGPGFNGNDYALNAYEQGASLVVVDEWSGHTEDWVCVSNSVLETMHQLSTYHLDQTKPQVLAIGGSNGKTTTKELCFSVLKNQFVVHATPGNWNNHIGLPLTILSMPCNTEILILELGTNQPGDMEMLCQISKPQTGILTNIGKEHLEGFGSIEGVIKEESYLFDYLNKNNGTAFINEDDPIIANMSKRLEQKCSFTIKDYQMIRLVPEIELVHIPTQQTYTSKLSGLHNVSNMAATASICRFFGCNEDDIAIGIRAFIPQNMRSQWIDTANNRIFLDTYNANPDSMMASIQTVQYMRDKPLALILGDMFELGDHSSYEHQQILLEATKLKPELLITVGQHFYNVRGHHHLSFINLTDLIAYLRLNPIQHHTVLVKGSRGMKMEDILFLL